MGPIPRYCIAPKLGGMVGEGCAIHLTCSPGEVITGIDFADWGQPEALGPDPLDPSACAFRSIDNCTSAVATLRFVSALCVGRNNCTITTGILNGMGDPCSGHNKRLAVRGTGCSSHPPPSPPPSNVGRHVLLAVRPDCWDNVAICAGPQPERLSNGEYLYIYNTDMHTSAIPSKGRCAIGWAILDGDNPKNAVARGSRALLVAELPFEVNGHTPRALFANGLRPMGQDEFIVTFGAADTDVGAARIKVHINPQPIVTLV